MMNIFAVLAKYLQYYICMNHYKSNDLQLILKHYQIYKMYFARTVNKEVKHKNLLWTILIQSMSPSKNFLLFQSSRSLLTNVLLSIPSFLLVFPTILSKWLVHFKSSPTMITQIFLEIELNDIFLSIFKVSVNR